MVTDGVLSMVEKLQAAPSVPLLAAAPEQYLLFGLTNGHSSVMTQTLASVEEDPAVPAGETIDSLVRPLVESAKTAPPDQGVPTKVAPPVEAAKLTVVEPPTRTGSPLAQPTPFAASAVHLAERAAPTAPQAKLAPPVESVTVTPAEPLALAPPLAEPAPVSTPVVKFAELVAPAASPGDMALPASSLVAETAPLPSCPPQRPLPRRRRSFARPSRPPRNQTPESPYR